MGMNVNSVSYTVLLLVLLAASTEIMKGMDATCHTFLGECGPAPFPAASADCFTCCVDKYGSPPACRGIIEGTDQHCHCYQFP
ncbi:hypothetical protein N665_0221s0063 [Sinapis alba]|nr:hypothetical protein N665_0221s0063 [Sinapis alba]